MCPVMYFATISVFDEFCEAFLATHADTIPSDVELFDTFLFNGVETFCFAPVRDAWEMWLETGAL